MPFLKKIIIQITREITARVIANANDFVNHSTTPYTIKGIKINSSK
jgi:hypothetical protein